ncbi:angiopoietin-related protein 5-like [Pseudophryne corroboree]|uniref:angiopoietin-related protein 5-like n=1 Tax=Pseudophryne corroboree TaxID=495146 RepID=UPI003081C125
MENLHNKCICLIKDNSTHHHQVYKMSNINLYRSILLLALCYLQIMYQAEGVHPPKEYDCSEIWKKDKTAVSGIYTIQPKGANVTFQVSCEMSAAGGWTLMQNHNGEDGLSFNQVWADFENGFGRLDGEHWLGLKYIFLLTSQHSKPSKLRISIGDFAGNIAYAQYTAFSVGNAGLFYKLSLGKYSGTAGDAFHGDIGNTATNQDGSYFSTQDQPNDNCTPMCSSGDILYPSCSYYQQAGWWFNACGLANLNGDWHSSDDIYNWISSVSWPTWRANQSLKFSKMYVIFD